MSPNRPDIQRFNRLKQAIWRSRYNVAFALAMVSPMGSVAYSEDPSDLEIPASLFQQTAVESARPLPPTAAEAHNSTDIQELKEARIRELERQIREVKDRISKLRSQRQTEDSKVSRESSTAPTPIPETNVEPGTLNVPDPMPIPVTPPASDHKGPPSDVEPTTKPETPKPPQGPAAPPIKPPSSPKTNPSKEPHVGRITTPTPTPMGSQEPADEIPQSPETTTTPPDRVLIPIRPGTPTATFPPQLPGAEATTESTATEAIPPPNALTGEIDRIALANSLFATGQFEQCLQTLDAILDSSLSPDDRHWKVYLRACCHRSLNNTQEAVRLYRNIVSGPKTVWTHDLAMWWLDHINERDQLIQQNQELKTVVTEFKKESEQFDKSIE